MGLFDRDKKPEKKKADFSNVESGSSSTAPEAEKLDAARTYTVEAGDTLWAIAEKYYGDGSAWPKIHEANRDRIEDPDLIRPGQVLRIPERTQAGGAS